MKTAAVLASSLLFGSLAVAAPVDRRAVLTQVVTETVVVYTTVYEDDAVAQATTTPAGYFYEQPKAPSSAAASSTSSSVQAPSSSPVAEQKQPTYEAPAPQAPTPTPQAPAPTPVVESPKAVDTPAPVESPKPVEASPSPAAPSPAPVSSSPAPAASSKPSNGGSTSQTYSNVDITIYDNNGGFGACGTALHDGDMIVALAKDAWGQSTYDVMTGAATNPWCGQKIQVEYQGNTIQATIMDLCPGCSGNDIDLSLAAWKALTGLDEKTRLKASWSKVA